MAAEGKKEISEMVWVVGELCVKEIMLQACPKQACATQPWALGGREMNIPKSRGLH